MKKISYLILAVFMLGTMLTGCSSLETEDSIVYIQKKGKVQTVDKETFDKEYYNEADFKAFAQEAIDTYNASNGEGAVVLKEFTLEGNTAKLAMEYQSTADYSAFHQVTLYQGTIAEAVGEGYPFDVEFSKVENGEITGSATISDILAEDGLSVVVVNNNTDIKVSGTICYVSGEHVTMIAKDTVSINDGEDTPVKSDVYTYIIYK